MTLFGGRFGGNLGIIEVVMVTFWIAILIGGIVLLFLAIRWLANQGGGSHQGLTPPASPPVAPPLATPRPDEPLEILRQRYARGEIDDEEYERRRRTLAE